MTTTLAIADRILDNYVVIIGAQRCGSTLLYTGLDAHPEVSMVKPPRPEPKILLEPGLGRDRLRGWIDERLGGLDPAARRFGEKSTSYIESDQVASTIGRVLPTARVLAIVRDPIERAVSNYRFSVANGLESASIGQAFRRELHGNEPEAVAGVSVSPFAYLRRGLYLRDLERFASVVGDSRLHIVVLEDLVDDADRWGRLYRWLGVDDGFRPGPLGRVNAAAGSCPDLPAPLLAELQDYFGPANAELARRFGLDLAPWR